MLRACRQSAVDVHNVEVEPAEPLHTMFGICKEGITPVINMGRHTEKVEQKECEVMRSIS